MYTLPVMGDHKVHTLAVISPSLLAAHESTRAHAQCTSTYFALSRPDLRDRLPMRYVFAASRQLDVSGLLSAHRFQIPVQLHSLLTHVASICLTWGRANMTFLLYPAMSFV
jgi:hypothetical protein